MDKNGTKYAASCWDMFHNASIANQPRLCCWIGKMDKREEVTGWSCSNPDPSAFPEPAEPPVLNRLGLLAA